MASDVIISVEGLGKRYRISHQQPGGMRYVALRDVLAETAKKPWRWLTARRPQTTDHATSPVVGSPLPNSPLVSSPVVSSPRTEDFWALRDVSFSVRQGEVLGIIGRNGAGKSTLLKILSRITEPTEGRARIRGRVASLLEVGTGFHAELTGRENIFLNGAILGMTKAEIKRKFDEIVAFSEVEKFLDTPVKRYSSGMYVRLAFAVAAHLEPEILVVDEVLAVGDAEFQKKCLGKMEEVSRSQGRTVLFVSHNLQAIRNLCNRCLVLDGGKKTFDGDTAPALEAYLGQDGQSDVWLYETANAVRRIPGSDLVRIEKVWFTSKQSRLKFGDRFQIQVQLSAVDDLADACFDLTFFNLDNSPVGTAFSMKGLKLRRGRSVQELSIPSLRFAPGRYYCDVAILKGNWLRSPSVHDVVLGILQFEVEFPQADGGTAPVWHAGWGSSIPEDISVSEVRTAN